MKLDRRNFLGTLLPTGALCYLGCRAALAGGGAKDKKAEHKFSESSGMSYEQVFGFAFQGLVIPTLQELSKGDEKFLEKVQAASSAATARRFEAVAARWPKRDFATFKREYLAMVETDPFMLHAISCKVLKNTDREFSLKVSECLWAKTFRQAKAADLGYALVCHPDYVVPTTVGPGMKMIRTKTLMQGRDCCDHRYVFEG